MPKASEVLPVAVEGEALRCLGWQVLEVRALLISDTAGTYGRYELSAVLDLKFNPSDWVEHYTPGRSTAWPVLAVACPRESPYPSYCRIRVPDSDNLSGPIQVVVESRIFRGIGDLTAQDFEVTLTAFDMPALFSDLDDIPTENEQVPISIIDLTTRNALKLVPDFAACFSSAGTGALHLRIAGTLETNYQFAVAELRESRPNDVYSRLVYSPMIVLTVFDAEQFVLDVGRPGMVLSVSLGNGPQAPRRQPSWIVDWRFSRDRLPGVPDRVSINFVDPLR